MLFKRMVLTKILENGMRAEFAVVKDEGEFKAALFVNGRHIHGPPLPEKLSPPRDDITHWMGNKPGVGLTSEEAERIIREVDLENSVLTHLKRVREREGPAR